MESQTNTNSQSPSFSDVMELLREFNRNMAEENAKWRAERKEQDAKWNAEQAELESKRKAEQAEKDAKWEKEMKAWSDRMDRTSEDTNRAIREMKTQFTTQWGRLVEALTKPAALALFKREGIEIDRIYEGARKAKVDGQDVMEIDVALCNTSVAVIVEVKSRCDRRDIDHFLDQMMHCKEWYKEFANRELRVAVAAITYAPGTEKYALKNGVYVLRHTGEETFTMSAPGKPREF